jgi:hypothetical protein
VFLATPPKTVRCVSPAAAVTSTNVGLLAVEALCGGACGAGALPANEASSSAHAALAALKGPPHD